ncbi:2,3-bisphosphoglycerate-dependent phosphoglycerate mutase [Apilactobacillus xinyiensis]|uniref:2,3-bisphosphoglycerate-dependent phosphoglycerate mutase n=1 Tax=Apilactobacillus xinyiensis TaxID=2841032 RepID=UPI00200F116C|nr:2,3-diphosphoglycerate-dependent phosphoglycerate mutase [Apilactobacillus xinyiensis]MCL0319099.1 2,3-diphosphoglycerate-dependent phosphoglycerate mutase [Apilactobacillus xinyiensis]
MVKLVIMRHGQSLANKNNIFTGWNDVPLTNTGEEQAHLAGQKLFSENLHFSDVHTSLLLRAIKTANIVLEEINQLYIDEHKSWRLNERHYGALRGKNKQLIKEKYGIEKFNAWRRGFYGLPPLLNPSDAIFNYCNCGILEPLGESLSMAYKRLIPYWVNYIAPNLINNKNQLVVAHGSTLRALIKFLEKIPDDELNAVEVPNAQPIIYTLSSRMEIIDKKII